MASDKGQYQAMVKAEMRVCKAQDVREETELIMGPHANWEEYLMPAPLSIAVLGQLIFISAGQGDFSINRNPPPQGFQYIKYPESFRACLCQVSNEGWHAFNEAHISMNQIRLLTLKIPEKIKFVVQTLLQELEVVKIMLPGQLESMKSIAEKCKALAFTVKEKYANVIALIQELLEACTNAEQGYKKDLEEISIVLKQAKIKENDTRKTVELAEQYHSQVKQQIMDSFKEYKKAIKKIPAGWEAVGMSIVENMGNALGSLEIGITSLFSVKFGEKMKISVSSGPETPNYEYSLAALKISVHSETILTYAVGLRELGDKQAGLNMDKVYNPKTMEVKTNWVKNAFLDLKRKMKGEKKCPPRKKAVKICKLGIRICEQLEQMATSSKKGVEEERALIGELEELYQRASEFDSYSKGILGAPAFAPKPPHVAKYQEQSTEESIGVRNAHLKVEQSREMLKAAQEEYQKSFNNLKRERQELANILGSMEECNVKEINFQEALKMLSEGLKAMGKVKTQWEKMVMFFQTISDVIDARLSQDIDDLITSASGSAELRIKGYSFTALEMDMLYSQVFSASNVAHLVHTIATTYTEVSEKHLMNRISSLGRLITLKPSDPDFDFERQALMRGCKEASEAICNMVKENKEAFDSKVDARMRNIDKELKALLPPISREVEEMVGNAVRHGIKEMTTWEEDQFA
ncbi:uncharacterized protein LOC129328408 [Eublepharis macularius]|uniref:Uncharacterized protein LOC129328408 n=1 Tax=Eublepharis macularius TaxID=481883 RepID=A0AA97KX59_EUBMA|nr:uncharacterized protein LOC129328408 [Eublepharis macularius]